MKTHDRSEHSQMVVKPNAVRLAQDSVAEGSGQNARATVAGEFCPPPLFTRAAALTKLTVWAVKPIALALAVLAIVGAGPIARADVTVVRNLGASGSGTLFVGGTLTPWSLGALPAGSFLKKVVINATLDSTNNDNYASELTLLVDPTPATPGGDFALATRVNVSK